MSLGSYLLKPVQRILKYQLLLKSLSESLEGKNLENEVTSEAQRVMEEVALEINRRKQHAEDYNHYLSLKEKLIDIKNFSVESSGNFVMELKGNLQGNEVFIVILERYLIVYEKVEDRIATKYLFPLRQLEASIDPKKPKYIFLSMEDKTINIKLSQLKATKNLNATLVGLKQTIYAKLRSKKKKDVDECAPIAYL